MMNYPETDLAEPLVDSIPELDLQEFIERMSAFEKPASESAIRELMGRLEWSEADLAPFLKFDKQTYQRNLIARNDNFEALLLCFESGQRTPIHDHAGSACGVKIIEGEAVETIFETSESGFLFASGSQQLHAGGVVSSVDMDTHQLSNLQGNGGRLVTLHVYSPPLGEVGNYSITDNSVKHVKAVARISNETFLDEFSG